MVAARDGFQHEYDAFCVLQDAEICRPASDIISLNRTKSFTSSMMAEMKELHLLNKEGFDMK